MTTPAGYILFLITMFGDVEVSRLQVVEPYPTYAKCEEAVAIVVETTVLVTPIPQGHRLELVCDPPRPRAERTPSTAGEIERAIHDLRRAWCNVEQGQVRGTMPDGSCDE